MIKTGPKNKLTILRAAVFGFACLLINTLLTGPAFAQKQSPQSLVTAFQMTFENVRSSLIEAPEASRKYVQTAIQVYNTAPSRPGHLYKTPPAQAVKEDFTLSGSWVPNGRPIISPEWANNTPLELGRADMFRPPAPPPIHSTAYQKALEEVFSIGEDTSETRLADQSIIGRFWADGLATISPPGRWNDIALDMSQNLPPQKKRELFLALNIALYDAGIAAWDTKYHYQYWRPQTAIGVANPDFIDWVPMMENPFHPEYVSGHSTFSGAGAAILTAFFGPQEFCLDSEAIELRGLIRCYTSFNAAADEAGLSRIYGGIHFSFSNKQGLELGRKVAAHTLKNLKEKGFISQP